MWCNTKGLGILGFKRQCDETPMWWNTKILDFQHLNINMVQRWNTGCSGFKHPLGITRKGWTFKVKYRKAKLWGFNQNTFSFLTCKYSCGANNKRLDILCFKHPCSVTPEGLVSLVWCNDIFVARDKTLYFLV